MSSSPNSVYEQNPGCNWRVRSQTGLSAWPQILLNRPKSFDFHIPDRNILCQSRACTAGSNCISDITQPFQMQIGVESASYNQERAIPDANRCRKCLLQPGTSKHKDVTRTLTSYQTAYLISRSHSRCKSVSKVPPTTRNEQTQGRDKNTDLVSNCISDITQPFQMQIGVESASYNQERDKSLPVFANGMVQFGLVQYEETILDMCRAITGNSNVCDSIVASFDLFILADKSHPVFAHGMVQFGLVQYEETILDMCRAITGNSNVCDSIVASFDLFILADKSLPVFAHGIN
ncbi:hypothetical protein J6590_058764 [Homalodisca vitripennis]|nr:hypothetical protein J6590_058764 [Homalodisca vitripennis]